MTKFGTYMHKRRLAKNMSLHDVAEKLHCSRQYIWLIESGKYQPHLELVDALVEVLEMDRTKAHVLNGTIRPDYYKSFVPIQDALAKAAEVIQRYGSVFTDAMVDALETTSDTAC